MSDHHVIPAHYGAARDTLGRLIGYGYQRAEHPQVRETLQRAARATLQHYLTRAVDASRDGFDHTADDCYGLAAIVAVATYKQQHFSFGGHDVAQQV